MNKGSRFISGVIALVMFLFFSTSAFAETGKIRDISNADISENVLFKNAIVEGNKIIEEFIDEEGRKNKMVIEKDDEKVVVSISIDGVIEQESTIMHNSGTLTGFSNYGEDQFVKELDQFTTEEEISANEFPYHDEDMVDAMAVGSFSQVAKKTTVANSLCNRTVTAYLYEKSSTVYGKKVYFHFTKYELLSAIVATIIAGIITKSVYTLSLLKATLFSFGISYTLLKLQEGFSGDYTSWKDTKQYYASILGGRYFNSTITKEYVRIHDKKSYKNVTQLVGTHNSVYGAPSTYDQMLSHAIINWSKGNCR